MIRELTSQAEKLSVHELLLTTSSSYIPIRNLNVYGSMENLGEGQYYLFNKSYMLPNKIIYKNNDDSDIYLIIDRKAYPIVTTAIASISSNSTISLDEWLAHMRNEDIHVTAEDKNYWNTKTEEEGQIEITFADRTLTFSKVEKELEEE